MIHVKLTLPEWIAISTINTVFAFLFLFFLSPSYAEGTYHFSSFRAGHPYHIYSIGGKPEGISQDTIKAVYHLPKRGGHGTIAIIVAYENATIENDLNEFSRMFDFSSCTVYNGCFKKHKMGTRISSNSGWNLESSMDVEWAHAIAPEAKILLVEAGTASGKNLVDAVDYAAKQKDVVAISMSFGGAEFEEEKSLDSHFRSPSGAVFFASSGDNGWRTSWPASSPNVVGVGGTTLIFNRDGSFKSEKAWGGSGGGISTYESQPDFQSAYSIPRSHGMRAVPDVSYNAYPSSGFSVYAKGRWYVLGGTSAGAPQWAAIRSLGMTAENSLFYKDKASDKPENYFRDIKSGTNGDCKYYCSARSHYDYITGLGSPVTVNF